MYLGFDYIAIDPKLIFYFCIFLGVSYLLIFLLCLIGINFKLGSIRDILKNK